MFIGTLVGVFYIPNSAMYKYFIAALFFSAIFILIQSLILVDFAHSTAEHWLSRFEDGSSIHKAFLIVSAFACYILFLVLTVVDYTVLTGQDGSTHGCKLNNFFISFNLIIVLIVTFISLLPKVRESNPRSGLLQASVISLYITYLITSAVSEDPYNCRASGSGLPDNLVTAMQVVGIALTIVAILYAALSTASDTTIVSSDEAGYNFSWFHFVFMLSAFYAANVLTNWRSLESSENSQGSVELSVDSGVAAMWVKVATSWAVSALYMWTLIAPVMFPNRDFSVR
jgi:hypothetical protein